MSIYPFLIEVALPIIIAIPIAIGISNKLKSLNEKDEEPETLKIYAERVNNTVLVYNADTHAFIVQVETKKELFEFFQTEFYYMNVIALEDNFERVFGNESI